MYIAQFSMVNDLESADKYGISVHGWINPFRVNTQKDVKKLSSSNPAKKILDSGNTEGRVCVLENGIYYNNVPRGLYGDVSNDIHMRETDRENITCFMYEELLAFKRAAEALKLSKQDVEDIMCNNAAKLFNISF